MIDCPWCSLKFRTTKALVQHWWDVGRPLWDLTPHPPTPEEIAHGAHLNFNCTTHKFYSFSQSTYAEVQCLCGRQYESVANGQAKREEEVKKWLCLHLKGVDPLVHLAECHFGTRREERV
jgi:hypothetical protein